MRGFYMKHEKTAKRLSLALSNANMSQQELSVKANIGKSSISQYMNGSHAPSNLSAGKIAKVLNVNPVWLMGFDVPMTESEAAEEGKYIVNFIELYSKLNENEQKETIKYMEYLLSKMGND